MGVPGGPAFSTNGSFRWMKGWRPGQDRVGEGYDPGATGSMAQPRSPITRLSREAKVSGLWGRVQGGRSLAASGRLEQAAFESVERWEEFRHTVTGQTPGSFRRADPIASLKVLLPAPSCDGRQTDVEIFLRKLLDESG